ncbi:hypothetical protein [Nitrincola tibetensis]|nr:hypothetical protein [Nitrincola tibetensis]
MNALQYYGLAFEGHLYRVYQGSEEFISVKVEFNRLIHQPT